MRRNGQFNAIGVLAGFLMGSILFGATATAQDGPFGKLRGLGAKSGNGGGEVVQASAKILPADKDHPLRLQVSAKIQDGWHIYSITQKPGGPVRTKIKVAESPSFKLGEFKAITAPSSHVEPLFDNLVVEEHEGTAVWEAPLTVTTGAGGLNISGAVNAQACKDSCLQPTDYKFEVNGGAQKVETEAEAKVEPAGEAAMQAAGLTLEQRPAGIGAKANEIRSPRGALKFRHESSHADLEARIEPDGVEPGGMARLVITVAPEPPYHLYAYAAEETHEIGRGKPTLIDVKPTAGLSFEPPATTTPVLTQASTIAPVPVERYYAGAVTWTIDMHVAADTAPGEYPISGVVRYQTCKSGGKDASCDLPCGAIFEGVLRVGAAATSGIAAVGFRPADYDGAPEGLKGKDADLLAAAGPAGELHVNRLTPAPEPPRTSLFAILGLSLLGGLILNLMPCVLPVIGLKLLSFISQAGQSRQRILALNLWYTGGVMLVFMVLATLAAGASLNIAERNLGWGEHFSSPLFIVAMSGLVFAMALSFLGIWEIPIPGFVGSGYGTELAAQEGPSGAFFKGVMSTILATPCSGPFLGSVFGFTITQPPNVIYLVYGAIGLGMASPYLLIGAFPALVRWLPKPGAWMETFKQLMGFVLLGTVIYLLSVLNDRYWIATLTLLLGLGVACWWIGRTPIYAELSKRLTAWGLGTAMAVAIGFFAFSVLVPHKSLIAWQPFSAQRATQLAASGKTVMVEFTANWCPTCQTNLKFAIDTEATKDLIEANGVVPLLADLSDPSQEISDALEALHQKAIPVLAIFPAGRAQEPDVLDGVITQSQLLDALKKAGPSLEGERGPVKEQRLSAIDGATHTRD